MVKTNSVVETKELGRELASRLNGGENLLLFGELGSGKTAFVQGLAGGLGVTEAVKSPTFIYLREYDLPLRSTKLAHFDLYRLPEKVSAETLQGLEIFERLADPDTITVVEWAERLEPHLPEPFHKIEFSVEEDDKRSINFPKKLRVG